MVLEKFTFSEFRGGFSRWPSVGRLRDPKSLDLHEDNPADWMFKYASSTPDRMDGIIDFGYLL